MDINQLIEIVKKKIDEKINCKEVTIQDKTFLHKSHSQSEKGKFHIKLIIESDELKELNKIKFRFFFLKYLFKLTDKFSSLM